MAEPGMLAVRFLVGGAIVSVFAAIGEVCKPKIFAGLFGSAPSVALATLSLTFASDGIPYATAECASMPIGTLGLVAYCAACVYASTRPSIPVWLGAGACWLVWAIVAFGAWALRSGVAVG